MRRHCWYFAFMLAAAVMVTWAITRAPGQDPVPAGPSTAEVAALRKVDSLTAEIKKSADSSAYWKARALARPAELRQNHKKASDEKERYKRLPDAVLAAVHDSIMRANGLR